MKKFVTVLVLAMFLCITPQAFAGPFDTCAVETRVDKRQSGRFIWKPLAAHFRQTVIVAPRRYFPLPPRVELYTLEGRRIERASLKSTGVCTGHPECLFAATFLTRRPGAYYQRQYGSVIVKFTPAKITEKAPGCQIYQLSAPKNRNEFRG